MAEEYDPEWLEWEKKAGRTDLPEEPNARREAFNAGLTALGKMLPPTDPEIQTHDEPISPEVEVRVYQPLGSEGKKLPLVVFAPGGGWQAGNLDTEDHSCRTICEKVGVIVVSIDYRKWPDAKYQEMIDDCFNAFQWAYDHADELGADRKRYHFWGGSAGASLAIAAVHKLVNSGQGERVSGLIAMAPMIVHPDAVPAKYKHLHTSYIDNAGLTPVVSGKHMLKAYDLQIGEERLAEPSWFPVAAAPDALKGFPRTYIVNTGKEALRDDGRVLEAGLEDEGIAVKRDVLPALPHYFWCFPVEKAGARFRETLVEGIKWVVYP